MHRKHTKTNTENVPQLRQTQNYKNLVLLTTEVDSEVAWSAMWLSQSGMVP